MISFFQRLKAEKAQAFILFTLLLLALARFLGGYTEFYGIDAYDESLSLQSASRGSFQSTWSPLYQVYYRILLEFFSGDALRAYYFNLALLAAALPLLFFLLLRRLAVSPILSFLGAYYVMIASFGAPLIPKAGHFNLVIVLLGLICASFSKNNVTRCILALASVVLAVFVRQEMAVVAVCLLALLLALSLKDPASFRGSHQGMILGVIFGAILLFQVFGNVFDSSRSWRVFADTFFYNMAPFTKEERTELFLRVFGPTQSLGKAFLANPEAFWWHVRANLALFLEVFPATMARHFPLTSNRMQPAALWESAAAMTAILATIATSIAWRWRKNDWPRLANRDFSFLVLFIGLALLLKTALVVVVFWAGAPRYFLDGIAAALLALLIFLNWVAVFRAPPVLVFSLAAVMLALTPSHSGCQDCRIMNSISEEGSVKKMIEYVRGMNPPIKNCFYTGQFDVFFGQGISCVDSSNPWERAYPSLDRESASLKSLKAYLEAMKFDYVLVNPAMRWQMREFGREEELDSFLQNHREWGFPRKHEIRPGEYVISRH